MTHAPKYAMLIALEHERLSPQGRKRAVAHLDRCERCRQAHDGLARYSAMASEARALPAPSLDVDRLALALRREAHERSKHASRRTLWQALAIAAVIGLCFFAAARLTLPDAAPSTARVDPPTTPQNAASDSASTTAHGTSAQGTSTSTSTVAAHPDDELTHGEALQEGARLLAEDRELRFELWQGTELLLHRGTQARVVMLRGHQVRVAIERGAITSQVAPLGDADRFEISVDELVVAVRGTRFVVERSGEGVADITLTEGKVDISRGDKLLTHLIAPARWSEGTAHQVGDKSTTREENGAVDEGTVTERGVRLSKGTTRNKTAGEVAPNAIKHLLARAAPLLRACHEQSRRVDPATPSTIMIALDVSADGRPSAVQLRSDQGVLNDAFTSCLRARVMAWHIPLQTAGNLRIEVPLSFSTSTNP